MRGWGAGGVKRKAAAAGMPDSADDGMPGAA